MKIKIYYIIILLFFGIKSYSYGQKVSIENILTKFAKSYESDVTFKKDAFFGVKVDDEFWTINATVKDKSVKVIKGAPSTPTYFFKTDKQTLAKIDKGEISSLTAAVKEFSSDPAPFDADFMKGFQPAENFLSDLLKIHFHFWNRSSPEIIPYGKDYTRFTHGTQTGVFYYQPGFRSGYVAIKKGQHANEDEKSRVNNFPTLLIAIKGEALMIIDGKKSKIKDGEAVLIPAGVSHEFLNPDKQEPFEGILLMFGDGA